MVALTTPIVVATQNIEGGAKALPLGLGQTVIAIASELKGVKGNSNSGMLVYTLEVIDGPNKGRTGDHNFNIYNENSDARRIAEESLAKMAWCCGVPAVTDSGLLHNKPFKIDVTPQPVKPGQEDKGYVEVSAYYDMGGNKPKNGTMAVTSAGGGQGGGQGAQSNGGNWGGNGGGQQPQQQQQQQQHNGNNGQYDNQNNGQQQQGGQHQQQPQQQPQQQQDNGGNWNGQQQNNGGQHQQPQQQQNNGGDNSNWGGQQQNNNGGNNGGNMGGGGGAAPWNRS